MIESRCIFYIHTLDGNVRRRDLYRFPLLVHSPLHFLVLLNNHASWTRFFFFQVLFLLRHCAPCPAFRPTPRPGFPFDHEYRRAPRPRPSPCCTSYLRRLNQHFHTVRAGVKMTVVVNVVSFPRQAQNIVLRVSYPPPVRLRATLKYHRFSRTASELAKQPWPPSRGRGYIQHVSLADNLG